MANLFGADLSGANLTEANLGRANLSQAKFEVEGLIAGSLAACIDRVQMLCRYVSILQKRRHSYLR